MPQRNRDRIMQQSLYDLLCDMNKQLQANPPCIMTSFGIENRDERCKEYGKCDKCIQAWLNEYPF